MNAFTSIVGPITAGKAVGAVLSLLASYNIFKRATHPVVKKHITLDNKVVIVTGANSGIGRRTAAQIASYSPTVQVILACRNVKAGEAAAKDIIRQTGNRNVDVMQIDLASYDSIRQFVKDFEARGTPLHILVNNAGILTREYVETPQGVESTFATNHLGTFLLTNLLIPKLKEAGKGARVVTVSSKRHERGKINLDDLNGPKDFNSITNAPYNDSKLANVLFAFELNRRLEGTGITSNAIHPGVIYTGLHKDDNWYFMPIYFLVMLLMGTTERFGAQTQIYAAVSPDLEGKGGLYLEKCAPAKAIASAYDKELARKLWVKSEMMVGLNK